MPISREKLRSQQNNILDLEDPESCTCVVEQYRAGHPALWIAVHKGRFKSRADSLQVVFTGVSFYEGPMQWIGANFRIASADKWLALMRELGWIEGAPKGAMDYLSEELRLFTVESQKPRYKVRIVAANVHKSSNRPKGFGRD